MSLCGGGGLAAGIGEQVTVLLFTDQQASILTYAAAALSGCVVFGVQILYYDVDKVTPPANLSLPTDRVDSLLFWLAFPLLPVGEPACGEAQLFDGLFMGHPAPALPGWHHH